MASNIVEIKLSEIDKVQEVLSKQNQEIERLNKRIEDLNIINEEHQILNGMIRKELQQKENIIKEVRECIDNITLEKLDDFEKYKMTPLKDTLIGESILEILDKGKE